jgi:hypothetical protein
VIPMKRIALLTSAMLVLCAFSALFAQKKAERPKVHADFYFGSNPVSRDAAELMAKDNMRIVLVGLHVGWDVEKTAKELKLSPDELNRAFDELEDWRLAGNRTADEDARPLIPVIRERDMDRVKDSVARHAEEFGKVLEANWADIDSTVSSLSGAKGVPKDQLMYQVVVSGILLGGMEDAFSEDKTLMSPPPRRSKGQRFYAWLVEGDPALAGTIKRETRESDGYSVVSIGPSMSETRVSLDQLRSSHGFVLEQQEARRFRSFVAILSRDKLLPFFKKNRADLLKIAAQVESGKYIAFEDFFAWYYNRMVNILSARLVSTARIAAPSAQYTYAIKLPQQ